MRKLKAKMAEPKPTRSLGTALGIQFAAVEVIPKTQLEETVKAERASILKRYRGLPETSEIQLSRRCILEVEWKH